jgi:hypothetical protein
MDGVDERDHQAVVLRAFDLTALVTVTNSGSNFGDVFI